jgi:hypothetical protein
VSDSDVTPASRRSARHWRDDYVLSRALDIAKAPQGQPRQINLNALLTSSVVFGVRFRRFVVVFFCVFGMRMRDDCMMRGLFMFAMFVRGTRKSLNVGSDGPICMVMRL